MLLSALRPLLRLCLRAACLSIALACAPQSACAQAEPAAAPQENLQIILTARNITIGANFSGTDFYIAGALENADPLLRRQNRYNIIVTLEGPRHSAALYKKERRLGLWVNGAACKFSNVPQFYALASTRELRDITLPQTYQNLGLGLDFLPIRCPDALSAQTAALYARALIQIKQQQGLYSQDIGSVAFGSAGLFSVRFRLPDNVPVGSYTVRAYLFRDGIYSNEVAAALDISRKNIAYSLYRAAQIHAFWYGLAAVLIAVCAGICGRMIFPK